MAKRDEFKMSLSQRRLRSFSEEFKREKVLEIESGKSSPSEISRTYQVSKTSVSRWVNSYSNRKTKGIKIIVEKDSDTKKIQAMQARIAELERLVGQKQIELEFKDKMIEIAEEVYKVDIKKKFESKLSSGSGNTGKA